MNIDALLMGKLVQVENNGILKSGIVTETGMDSGNTGYEETQTQQPYVKLMDDNTHYYKVHFVLSGTRVKKTLRKKGKSRRKKGKRGNRSLRVKGKQWY
jgi:hypothetical protein